MSIDILCTLGPASMNRRVITRLDDLGVSLFRVNLSHTALDQVESVVRFIQECSDVPVCLDTEGAQVRTAALAGGAVTLSENSMVTVHAEPVAGDANKIALYPSYTVGELRPGDFISIDFNAVLTQVVTAGADQVLVRVLNGGRVGSNKAVTVYRDIAMPALTDKDRAAIAIGRRLGVRHFALSFANHAKDVTEIRDLAGDNSFIISKIECRNGLDNLAEIAARSDAILIDRGDLSREIPIERIPSAQKYIIRIAKDAGHKVYVATNLLETMVSALTPTRAEVNDIFNTLHDGADGLVLAAETAIGLYPINCATMVRKLVREFESGNIDAPASEAFSLLPEAHGGILHVAQADDRARARVSEFSILKVPEIVLRDAEQIALGVFSPLDGFMTHATLDCVLAKHRLPSGLVWTMPIVFPIPRGATIPRVGERIALADDSGQVHVTVDVEEIYRVDLRDLARRWFKTESARHPGVARLLGGSDQMLAGKIELIERLRSPLSAYELTPQQCRFVFTQKGWTRVVGFHGRNVPHRAHEWIQLNALDRTHADGLFISPVIGPRKSGDFLPGAIIRAYEVLLESGHYPEGRAVLGAFSSYPRYSGPREAIFTALCRKNMGCSHFIIGRDHTGVGDFYHPDDNRRLFDALGDIGIEPVFFDPIGYDEASGVYVNTLDHPLAKSISGTEVRRALTAGQAIPYWAIRKEVQDALRHELSLGRELFCA